MKFHAPSALVKELIILSGLAVLLCTAFPAVASAEGGVEKVATEDPVLDRNGDGFQDVIVNRKRVHYDVDFDGQFDYTLSLHLSEYPTSAHKRYIASGCDPEVFDEITMECLDELCATSREEARWYENNFRTFTYYGGWYPRLYLFADSSINDGRLTSKKHKGEYEYWITFNPDGTIKSVKNGEKSVSLAEFDYESKTSSGKKVTLPKIATGEDMDRVRTEVAGLLE